MNTKILLALFAALAICLAGCSSGWTRYIDGCKVGIRECGDLLKITVDMPAGVTLPEDDPGVGVAERALAEYLNVPNDGAFECPGLTVLTERPSGTGRVFVFQIPRASLRIVKK